MNLEGDGLMRRCSIQDSSTGKIRVLDESKMSARGLRTCVLGGLARLVYSDIVQAPPHVFDESPPQLLLHEDSLMVAPVAPLLLNEFPQ